MMEKIVLVVFRMVWIIITSQGLKLSFHDEVGVLPDSRLSCGILSCVETIPSTSSSRLPQTDLSQANISSMTLLKTLSATSDAKGQTTGSLVVASLTLEKPTMTLVTDAVKIDGRLRAGQATLRLELTQQEDCQAEFTCQVRVLDAQGRKLVRTSRLLPQSGPGRDPVNVGQVADTSSSQVLVIVQQMDNRIRSLEKLLRDQGEIIKDKLQSSDKSLLEKEGLEDRMESLGKEFSNKMHAFENRLEDKLAVLQNKIEAFENRVEDKIENNIGNKLWQVNEKVSAIKADGDKLVTDIGKTLEENLQAVKGELYREHHTNNDDDLLNISEKIELTVNTTLTSMRRTSRHLVADIVQDQLDRSVSTLAEHVTEIYNKSRDRDQNVQNQLAVLVENLQQLDSTVNRTATETQSALQTLVGRANTTSGAHVRAVMTDLLMPKTCEKGAVSILSQSSFPYPVIYPSEQSELAVPYLCDTVTDGGGWIVIQRRTRGTVDFYRDWAKYKIGFGSLDDDFWLGNENIHRITSSGTYELRVELKYKGKSAYAHYSLFSIGNERSNYALSLGAYSGTAGESFSRHNRNAFSTFDRDNDLFKSNCAQMFTGGWWYKDCHDSNLNGKWNQKASKGPRWKTFSKADPVSFSEMKIRRRE